jgi:23S rRNA (guanosine2251-2'-O)-methyltransferase
LRSKTDRPVRSGGRPYNRRRDERSSRPVLEGEVLYGRNAVLETLGGRREFHRLLLGEGVREDERIKSILEACTVRGVAVEHLDRDALDFLTGTSHHQGVALVVGAYPYAELDDILEQSGTVLILDHVQDPQNFGTLLRTAEATGIVGVIMPQDRAVAVTPAVVNSSSGAVEYQRVCRVPNIVHAINLLKARGWWIAGLEGVSESQDLFSATIPTPVALVVGSEGSGLGTVVTKNCDLLLSIPMVGRIASLNASTAGSIALYELFRRSPHQEVHEFRNTVD